MSGKPKPLTKAEWDDLQDDDEAIATIMGPRLVATIDALFAYRERTRGICGESYFGDGRDADEIATELRLE